ncbi:MAG: VWA domain-containing protein [Gemmataceae bacterium]|nr:VWA domain-containing protein [Gemmataceae bacterium]
MNFRLENLAILFGLFALAVPILLHLLQRHRFDVMDWGAMQFLPDSSVAQRRRWLDEILLMFMRMAMIALIVIALATPVSTSPWLAPLRDRSTRDIVLIFDGSYSMGVRHAGQPTPWEEGVRTAKAHLEQATYGDRFAIVIGRQPPLVWQEDFSSDMSDLRAKLDALPAPRGNPDMPGTLSEAWKHLQSRSKATAQEIIVFTDQQLHGWADLETLSALENLGNQWQSDGQRANTNGDAVPSLRVVKVGADLPKSIPNFSLAPLTASRGVVKAGQKITLQSALHLDGFSKYVPPRKLRVAIDGQPVKDLALPDKIDLKQGQIPLSYQHRFEMEGQHVVSFLLEADQADDALTTDNAQHIVIEVVKDLPILLVDGDKKLSPESSSFFLQRAMSVKRATPYLLLKPTAILPEAADTERPAVIVLADVPRLDAGAIDALDRFLAEGGGLLIVVGERVSREKTFYNDQLYRQGQGWLPARLAEVASSQDGMQPEPRTFQHPALELFRTAADGVMNQVRFAKWLKAQIGAKDRAMPVALLANGDPFLIEIPYKKGRVMLCTTPLDRRWGSTLPNVAEFPVLVNELVYYLAGAKQTASTLRDGAPIRLPDPGVGISRLTLHSPEAAAKIFDVKNWPWTYPNTGAVGLYQAREAKGRAWSFVVPPDLRESNLTRCTDLDWRKVRDRLPVVWNDDGPAAPSIGSSDSRREELWWLLLLGVLGLLCSEVWMTRRMALARGL